MSGVDARRASSFYVLASSEPRARLKLACRLAEKAYLAGQRVLVRLGRRRSSQSFDELLWTFADRSFVPHERYRRRRSNGRHTPVLLSCQAEPTAPFDVLLNLAAEMPGGSRARRRASPRSWTPMRRAAAPARERFRRYRDRGLAPADARIRGRALSARSIIVAQPR